MPILKVLVLAIIQGLAELLPVSSSAHVVVAEKLMGLDPTSPQMTLLLVMLHTGTMFAVIVYFWKRWRNSYFKSTAAFMEVATRIVIATVLTGIIGYPIQKLIEKTLLKGQPKAEIEQLFGRLDLIAAALFCVGVLIVIAGFSERRSWSRERETGEETDLTNKQAAVIGAVQGLSLPFRGFSRSGSTISAGMLASVPREAAETFSFALAVVLTPAVVGRELLRLVKATHEAAATGSPIDLHGALLVSAVGMVLAFFAGLAGLRWLSTWLEAGRWYLFGIYCIVASLVVFYLHTQGY